MDCGDVWWNAAVTLHSHLKQLPNQRLRIVGVLDFKWTGSVAAAIPIKTESPRLRSIE